MTIKHYPWTYAPGTNDLCSPNVIKGRPIKKGAKVRVAFELQPRMAGWTKYFRFIEDEAGNVQSIWKKGITK